MVIVSCDLQISTQRKAEGQLWDSWVFGTWSGELWLCVIPYRHVERWCHHLHAVGSNPVLCPKAKAKAVKPLQLKYKCDISNRSFSPSFFFVLLMHTRGGVNTLKPIWECHCISETDFYNGRKSLFGTDYLTELNFILLVLFQAFNVREIKKEMQMRWEWKPDIRAWGMSASTNPLMKGSGLWETAKRSWKHNIYLTPITIQKQSPSQMGHGLGTRMNTPKKTTTSVYNFWSWITKVKMVY